MTLSDQHILEINSAAKSFLVARQPPKHIRKQLDVGYRIEGQSVFIFEIRPAWDNPDKIIEIPVAKTTFVKQKDHWKVYWMRADLKWHEYQEAPTVKSVNDFFILVDRDEFSCFWG